MARVAEALAVSWDTANDAVLAEGWRVLIGDPNRLDGVAVIGVDEHCWRHTRGFKTAAAETVPDAVAVMDPFHVVALAGDALERCRQRVQQQNEDTVAAPATRSTASAACCAPAPTCSPIGNANG